MKWVAALLLLSITVTAQRQACIGIFTDLDGQPIARAQVTFAQEHSQCSGIEPDHVQVVTDADGRFSAQLVPGSPYFTWAISKPEERGERWLTGVSLAGVAGKKIELKAERRAGKHKVQLRGVAAWKQFAPPALRVLIDGRYAVGPDLPLSGDGAFELPPWPGGEAALALVDDKRQVMCISDFAWENGTIVTFPAPRAFEVRVVDGRERPLAGAEIRTMPANYGLEHRTGYDPLPGLPARPFVRVFRTDDEGRGTVHVPWPELPTDRYVTIVATLPGHCASVAGFSYGQGFSDSGPIAEDGEPIRFVLDRQEASSIRVLGVGADQRARIQLALHTEEGGHLWSASAAELRDDVATTIVPEKCSAMRVRVEWTNDSAAAPRVCVRDTFPSSGEPTLDLGRLRARTVAITDSRGAPAAFAQVAIAWTEGELAAWQHRCVADATGRVQLLADEANWTVVALAGTQFRFETLTAADPAGEFTMAMEELPVARLRIRGPNGRLVASARLEQIRLSGAYSLWWKCARTLILAARSNGQGILTLPLAKGDVQGVTVKHGKSQLREVRLLGDGELREVVLYGSQ